ncbi:MAG: DUF1269 domain-containing protein [Prochloraceae cyanobacterium]
MEITNNYKRALGVFKERENLENALHKLKERNFDFERISVIARDDRAPIAQDDVETKKIGNKAEEGATTGAVTGGVLGTATGLLVGLGILAIPGIGPILLAGAEATAIATTLAGTAIGAAAGGLVGALIGLGIPEEKAKLYHDRVCDGYYLLIITDTEESIDRAGEILGEYEVENWEIYDVPQTGVSSTTDLDSNDDIATVTEDKTLKTVNASPEVLIVDRRK